MTLVTHKRLPLFGDVANGQMQPTIYGKAALEQWDRLPARFHGVSSLERTLMPNHFHGILVFSDPGRGAGEGLKAGHPVRNPLRPGPANPQAVAPGSLGAIIRAYKSAVTFRINAISTNRISVWQRNYYEHIIRDEAELQKIVDYIQTNPARWNEDRFYIT